MYRRPHAQLPKFTYFRRMASRLLYLLILKPISLLPHWALYRVSDFVYLLFITVFPYRKKVVLGNIQRCFPEKSRAEHASILKKFYRHLADVFVETFKNFSISLKQVNERMPCTNPELLNDLAARGKSIVITGGHYNNWELYALAAAGCFTGRTMAIYKKIKDPYFDALMRRTRGKFGLELVPTREASDWMRANANDRIASIYAIDQSPADPKKGLWLPFLNQNTLCHYGAEKHAREYEQAVVYGHIKKVRRGYYTLTYELLAEDVSDLPKGEVIRRANAALEGDILAAPEFWLWSHKRWKHCQPANEQ